MSHPRPTLIRVDELTDRERLALDIAGRFYVHQSSRDEAARTELGMTAIRYTQFLNALIDRPAAIAYSPSVVNRLRRLRERRRAG